MLTLCLHVAFQPSAKNKARNKALKSSAYLGAPEEIRTPDPQIRSPVLCFAAVPSGSTQTELAGAGNLLAATGSRAFTVW
jgi:hypothetical protein